MSVDEAQLPGGRGERRGPDALVDQDEALDVRRRLEALKDGWLISTVGEVVFSHQDVTGCIFTANELGFHYVPDRVRRVLLREARINVVVAAAASTFRSALYVYDNIERKRRLLKVPGSEVVFDGASTGLKQVRLPRDIEIPTEAKVFIGRWSSDATLAVEGFQSGAGAAPRVIRQRIVSSITPPFGSAYEFASIPVSTSAADTPLIAYLSPDAMQVL